MKRKRKGNVSPLAAELTSVLRKAGASLREAHPEIWARWQAIVGAEVARRTFPRSLRSGMLVIAVSSSSWMQELSFLKGTLLDRFAEAVGPDVVQDIRFVVDPRLPGPEVESDTAAKKQEVQSGPLPQAVTKATEAIENATLRETVRRAARANIKS